MRLRNFALIVGGAVVAAFTLCMLLPSCGGGDCPCDYPDASTDAGPDWFDTYYPECIDMCDAAKEWATLCGWTGMRPDCVEWLWWKGIDQEMCVGAAKCYDVLAVAEDCGLTVQMDKDMDGEVDPGWDPTVWTRCRMEIP